MADCQGRECRGPDQTDHQGDDGGYDEPDGSQSKNKEQNDQSDGHETGFLASDDNAAQFFIFNRNGPGQSDGNVLQFLAPYLVRERSDSGESVRTWRQPGAVQIGANDDNLSCRYLVMAGQQIPPCKHCRRPSRLMLNDIGNLVDEVSQRVGICRGFVGIQCEA